MYHYEALPEYSTPRKCVVCLEAATRLRFRFAQTQEVNQSSKQYVCSDH